MDHLPRYRDCAPSVNIDVPYLCNEKYDGEGFFDYPARRGWDKGNVLANRDFGDERPLKDVQSFLQTWLFFGLLTEVLKVCGVDLDTMCFVDESDGGGKIITTRTLPVFVKRWGDAEATLPRTERQSRLAAITDILQEACQWSWSFASFESDGPPFTPARSSQRPLPPEVELSIQLLARSLSYARIDIYKLQYTNALDFNWGHSDMLLDWAWKGGWCPYDIERLRNFKTVDTQCTLMTQYYCSSVPPPRSNGDHSRCSRHRCRVDEVNENSYVVKHCREGCECSHLVVSQSGLADVLGRDKIPLVVFNGASDHRLRVISHDTPVQYVAFSHVWSDGLGNPRRNSLPECQLERLQGFVDALYEQKNHTAFWIDTLCVPQIDGHNTGANATLRVKAIRLMHQTYADAEKVLVLDSGLMEASKHAGSMELSARVALSRWTTRLWTLQEAVLGMKNLHFQFQDGPLSSKDLDAEYSSLVFKRFMQPELRTDFQFKILETLVEFRVFFANQIYVGESEDHIERFFRQIWCAVQWRETTKAADESICLATLFRLDPGPLLSYDGELKDLRMPLLLKMLARVPPGIIFLPGPRLQEPGMGWAPQTWLMKNNGKGTQIEPFLREDRLVPLLEDGSILVRYPGFVLAQAPRVTRNPLLLTTVDLSNFWILQLDDHNGQDAGVENLPVQAFAVIVNRPIDAPYWYRGVVVLITDDFIDDVEHQVRFLGLGQLVFKARIYCHAMIRRTDDTDCAKFRAWWQRLIDADEAGAPEPRYPLCVEEKDVNQFWRLI